MRKMHKSYLHVDYKRKSHSRQDAFYIIRESVCCGTRSDRRRQRGMDDSESFCSIISACLDYSSSGEGINNVKIDVNMTCVLCVCVCEWNGMDSVFLFCLAC